MDQDNLAGMAGNFVIEQRNQALNEVAQLAAQLQMERARANALAKQIEQLRAEHDGGEPDNVRRLSAGNGAG